MSRFLNAFTLIDIDLLVYKITEEQLVDAPQSPNIQLTSSEIDYEHKGTNLIYTLKYQEQIIHKSTVFQNVHVLRLIDQKKNIAIGDCFTQNGFRGKSIYPFMINTIAKEQLKQGHEEIFILVAPNNIPSIRGIEKAKFIKHSHIQAKRLGPFYFKQKIHLYEQTN